MLCQDNLNLFIKGPSIPGKCRFLAIRESFYLPGMIIEVSNDGLSVLELKYKDSVMSAVINLKDKISDFRKEQLMELVISQVELKTCKF
ncbi:hypothetical protein RIF29_11444 [Crotalaria pallida]|uniref:Uncharacterized protein n=1 Tax=Crotalaria pallida TaxID=3830 RepID=A0AAN9IM32_CROPI